MKIAVASADGVSLSSHFGRSRCFIVFTVENGKITGQEVRDNTHTAHAQGQCRDGADHRHDQPHSHAAVVEALRDCQALLCGGMGWRAAEDLNANGIRPVVVGDTRLSPEQAVRALLDGSLGQPGPFCRCHE
jgi:predicted Fe-Mo cluster-binding NifX family protein